MGKVKMLFCQNCGRLKKYDPIIDECDVCGTKMKTVHLEMRPEWTRPKAIFVDD